MPDLTINKLGDEAQRDNHAIYDSIRPSTLR